MSEKQLFEYEPDTGATTTFEYDEGEDRVILKRTEDVEPIIEHNKALQNSGDMGWMDKDKSMRKVAHIPNAIVLLWKQMYGIDAYKRDHEKAVLRLLDSSEWSFLRTNNVRLL